MSDIKSWEEAVAYCKSVLEKFTPKHKRVKIFIGFEVQPAVWRDCPHAENPKQALKMAKREDEIEQRLMKRKSII
ncbi:MAG: hypothetical protein ACPLYF_03260 [Fervidobacterium sp.]